MLCAGVPGAGGNDAIFAIIVSNFAREQLEDMWSRWSVNGLGRSFGTTVCPLVLSADQGVSAGVRIESALKW